MKILFIGNSHTFVHYVPLRVKAYFEMCNEKADVTMLTHPGMGLDWHLDQSPTYLNLIYGDYDAVVLQHNAHPFPGKQSLIDAGLRMKQIIPENSEIFLYMAWSEKNNPQGQAIMSESYEELAEKIDANVCPVGMVWWKVKEKYPEDELYFDDGEHTSVFGASLAAAVIARTILHKQIDVDSCYEDAKVLERIEMDGNMIDLVMEDGQYKMKAVKDI